MSVVPNMRIVMRDDWIEIEICSYLAGIILEYRFHRSGTVVKREITESTNLYESNITNFYTALSEIADMTADNIEALGGLQLD